MMIDDEPDEPEDSGSEGEDEYFDSPKNATAVKKDVHTNLNFELQQRIIEEVIEGVKSGTKSGTKSKDKEVYNSMERMMEIKSREKLGLKPKRTDESLLDEVEIEGDDMEGSELIDAFEDNTNDILDDIATEIATKVDHFNTDFSDENSCEPSHVLLQNRLKQIKRVQLKSLPQ